MRNIEHQIDLLFSRQEQLRKDSEENLYQMRRLIPLTDLEDRAALQAELTKVSATLAKTVEWVKRLDDELTETKERLQEARDAIYRAGLWEEE